MELTSDPTLKMTTRAKVLNVQFSPYEWSRSLLAVALPSSLAVYSITFKEENDDGESSWDLVWECHMTSEIVALEWSPAATLRSTPKCLQLLVATADHKVLQLSSDLDGNDTFHQACSHSDFINDVAYCGDTGELAASTGEDLVAKVWRTETTDLMAKFLLTSPGVKVIFHSEDPDLLLVGERCGILRIYSITTSCATLALHCPGPMLSVDWPMSDPSHIVAAGPNGLTMWNLSAQQPAREHINIDSDTNNRLVRDVAVCRSSPQLVASLINPHTLRVSHLSANRIPMVVQLKVVGGMSWHLQLPYLCVGSDRKIMIWKVDNV